MKSLKELCVPRQSVFDPQKRDTVLDLTDLIDGKIDPVQFFAENYVTEGMKSLLQNGFKRLEGKTEQGVYKLKQAMGGGKTHNLLTLGLLARHPELRSQVLAGIHNHDPSLGEVKVIAFTGRESDAPYGIWGSLAEQMGKPDHFKDCYSPLAAPGQKSWENLFDGESVLILLDELPPYFEYARSKSIGNSDLAMVTATALSNLLSAVAKNDKCSRVCLVITDLAQSYRQGSAIISQVLSNLNNETQRTAMDLEPVRLNSDELYHILRTRLFESLPNETEIGEVASGYAQAIRNAKQMSITTESPEEFAGRINLSFPFHPGIRDLYARFRENDGFQQTRGLIRLMRIVTSRMWNNGSAENSHLISAHDIDLNDQETRTEISQINNSLDNAIAHDLADEGRSVSEVMDTNLGSRDATDAATLLFMSSLANVPNAVVGLTIPELVAYLCEPGRDLSRLKADVLEKLSTAAWYLHSNREGRLFFKNTENLIAKLESYVKNYQEEQALKELRVRLQELFKPTNKWCYQRLQILPPLDEIELEQDHVTLVITEPAGGSELRPELKAFFEDAQWKNRVAYLTGTKNTYETLIDVGKRLKAIDQIIEGLKSDKVADNDPQMIQAGDIRDKIHANFHSVVRETFTTLWYPVDDAMRAADFVMRFEGNRYTGEGQVLEVLKGKMKFTDDISSDTFRKKCEQRLFTQQSMPWNEIRRRAATNTKWQWHRTDALDQLKADCIYKGQWREDSSGFVDKGPFPQPKTAVQIVEQTRDDDTGKVSLRITPTHGDSIYWEVGGMASESSEKLDGNTLETDELKISVLAVDSTGVHESGPPVTWQNRITIKHKVYQSGDDKMCELRAAPNAPIRYTTDGSDPKVAGAAYESTFVIPKGAPMILVHAERDGISSNVERINISWDEKEEVKVEPALPVTWKRRHQTDSTQETYEFLGRLTKYKTKGVGIAVTIGGESGVKEWVELTTYEEKQIGGDELQKCLEPLREVQGDGQVKLTVKSLYFESGQSLLDWVEDAKTTLSPNEIKQ